MRSFLAIEPFISEIAMGTDDLRSVIPLKHQFVDAWLSAGVPLVLDVSPGYDARTVFPAADNRFSRIGNNDGQVGSRSTCGPRDAAVLEEIQCKSERDEHRVASRLVYK
jgi:hypothetical protein